MGVCWAPVSVALCTDPGFIVTLKCASAAVRLIPWPVECGFPKQMVVQSRTCSFWSTARNQSAERGMEISRDVVYYQKNHQNVHPKCSKCSRANLLKHQRSSVSNCCPEVRLGWPGEGAFSLWPGWAPAWRHLKQFVQHMKCSTQSNWAWLYSYFYLKVDRSLKVLSVLVCMCSWVGPWRKYFCGRIIVINITLECLLVVGLLCRALGSQFMFSIAVS